MHAHLPGATAPTDAEAAQTAPHQVLQSAPQLAPAHRAACAVAALATTTLGLALLLGHWQPRTELLWLTASPSAHAEILACDQEAGHSARARCRQAIIDDRLHAAERSVTVATAASQPTP